MNRDEYYAQRRAERRADFEWRQENDPDWADYAGGSRQPRKQRGRIGTRLFSRYARVQRMRFENDVYLRRGDLLRSEDGTMLTLHRKLAGGDWWTKVTA